MAQRWMQLPQLPGYIGPGPSIRGSVQLTVYDKYEEIGKAHPEFLESWQQIPPSVIIKKGVHLSTNTN